jgi:hypothetical protein
MKQKRIKLKQLLGSLPVNNVEIFKRMYSPNNLNKDINIVVDEMPDSKIDWAISQCETTVKKVAERRENHIKSIFNDDTL